MEQVGNFNSVFYRNSLYLDLITTKLREHSHYFLFLLFFKFFFFGLFRATHVAYGSSQAKGRIGAVAAGLRRSHNNARSKPHL